MELLDELRRILGDQTARKARELARLIGVERREVNQVLHSHPDIFTKVDEAHWSLAGAQIQVAIPPGWTTARSFEEQLRTHASLATPDSAIFSFAEESKLMFDAIGLFLTLVNQLAEADTVVTLSFPRADCSLLTFLARAGFFDQLNASVAVLPSRPPESGYKRLAGNSSNLVELVRIEVGHDVDNSDVCTPLTERFVHHSSESYRGAALTLFGELINNVSEHSCSTAGFAGLQKYESKSPHLQTIVSDRGLGIAQTLRPSLRHRHHEIFRRVGSPSLDNDVELVQIAVEKGHVSRVNDVGRGLGLIRSHECSRRFSARFSIRQEHFSLSYSYRDGQLKRGEVVTGLFPLRGTQICFDFQLG